MVWMPPPNGIAMCQCGDVHVTNEGGETSMNEVNIVGIDLAKSVFQI